MKRPVKQLLTLLALLAGIASAGAQTVTPIYFFTGGHDGTEPFGGLMQANDGYLYGTTELGGTNGWGAIFRLTTNGAFTPLYSFTGGHDGGEPYAALMQANDGYLYGTTSAGGTNLWGTVYRLTTNGVFTPLYSFTGGSDGANPYCTLVQANDGYLYGMTSGGGTDYWGTIFRITTNGNLTSLYSFTNGSDGSEPEAGLIQAGDGYLYGTASYGGTGGNGSVFRITTNGVLTPLYDFTNGNDGSSPYGNLVQASDGNLYGTASAGGSAGGNGTVFRITTGGTLTPLYSFTGGNDGDQPYGALVQAPDSNLYGTAEFGGADGGGTLFRLPIGGALTPFYSFYYGQTGDDPNAGLVLANNGILYGTLSGGGTNGINAGAVFELTLPPPALIMNILSAGHESILSWPAWASNSVVQSTTNLASPNWANLNLTPTPGNPITLTVTNSRPAQYFRLMSP